MMPSQRLKLRHVTDTGEQLPIIFIQIMPLLSWGPSFNFSIWYVELIGQDDPIFVRTSLRNYNMVSKIGFVLILLSYLLNFFSYLQKKLREFEIVKLCLKHFRQQGYESAFGALQSQTHVQLEHNMMTDLHQTLVVNGHFFKAEKFIDYFANRNKLLCFLSTI